MTFCINFFSNKRLIGFISFLILQLAIVYQPSTIVCNFYFQNIFDVSFLGTASLRLVEWVMVLTIINAFSIGIYNEEAI